MGPLLDLRFKFPPEAYHYGKRSSGETHGVVLTKPHIVELILDLAGWKEECDLSSLRLLEPSCGTGAFLVPAVRRLIRSARRLHRKPSQLKAAIVAFDIDEAHVVQSRRAVETALNEEGIGNGAAKSLAEAWVRQDDFLLAVDDMPSRGFDAVVGNPPYIRIEFLSPDLQAEYRRRYESLYDRADIYVAFIERGLELLSVKGTLSFICADRWTLNRYGAPLRKAITSKFHVKDYIDLHEASPFESEVIAYPSIFSISRGNGKAVKVAKLKEATPKECNDLLHALSSSKPHPSVLDYPEWFSGSEPWVLNDPEHLRALRDLESRFGTLEERGAKVRIGIATGNDAAYIVPAGTQIEKSRLVPLVMRKDLSFGTVADGKRFVINTFDDSGKVIRLDDYPGLRRHLESNGVEIKKRHVAQKNPRSWFRTIDRVYPELVSKPKLLIPDIAGSNEITLETGKFYPHHNLYFITSDEWDMEVLGALLSSKVALFFIWSYATKMRGSYLRFQAQYLRRIRVPAFEGIPAKVRGALKVAFRKREFREIDGLALKAYGLEGLPAFDFVDTR